MLYELILFVTGTLLLASLALVLDNFIKCRLAYWNFKKKSNNLPLIDQLHLVGNHAISLPVRKNLSNELLTLHETMGPTIGWLYNDKFAAISVDLDLIKLFIYDEPNKHINRFQPNFPLREIERSLMLAQDDDWRKIRRRFAPAFKSSKFKEPNVIHEIESSIKKLIDQIERELNQRKEALGPKLKAVSNCKEFKMDDLVHKYTLDLVFSCFYKQYDLIDFSDDDCHWTKTVDEGLEVCRTSWFIRAAMLFPVLKPVIDWLIWHFHAQGKWRQSIANFVKAQTKLGMEARKQAKELQMNKKPGEQLDLDNFVLKDGTKFKRNMMDYVIDHFLDGKLTKDELFDTSIFLVTAADKSSSDSVVHTLYLLGRHQDIQEKLRRSIQADGADSEYLAWVISESMRLQPPGPTGCTRTVTRDIELADGKILPANTLVLTPPFVIHRLKKYWGEDAEEFRPERWQDTSNFHPCQYIPFGAGIRSCPGKEFALFELKMLFAALLTRYKFECRHKEDVYTFDAPFLIFIIPNSPTYITIKRLELS